MSKVMKEIRTIHSHNLRSLCMEKGFYTKGAISDYNRLLSFCESLGNVDTADIVEMARDIKKFSDTDRDISNICFEIARICLTYFEEE